MQLEAKFLCSNSVFKENFALQGGAIQVNDVGYFEINKTDFISNSAQEGSVILMISSYQ